jgi:CarboxypepD_reg-like domain/TonB-dependent Receptor Plug Domain
MKTTRLLFIFILITLGLQSIAQVNQTLKGTIIDKQSESPLVGAAVQVLGINPQLGSVADENGNFEIKNVPTGRHTIQVTFIGYNPATIPNIVVNAGKETVLNLSLEESVTKLDAVTISGKTEKTATNNELATISARQFNVEEVQRFSGGRNDVSRLVANFAGVAVANDSRNDIVIRGNSPSGVLWRLEGIPIPNPNHYSTLGATGGPVSALNPNMIRNSDFLTSAFPSEYGNATAGVFDIGLRTGNREKYEFTAQLAAFTGFEAMAEGPLSKKTENGTPNGSFVVAYRHSFAEVANAVGLNIGTKATPKYKDLTFNVDLGQTKLGKFSLFGIGGLSTVDFIGKDLKEDDFFADPSEDAYATSKLGILGLRYNILIDNNTYVRTVVSGSYSGNKYNVYKDKDSEIKKHVTSVDDATVNYRVSSFLNKKFNSQWSMRSGFLYQNLKLKTDTRDRTNSKEWAYDRKFNGDMNLVEVYSQAQYKANDRVTINGGVHTQYLDISKKYAFEPRVAFNYHISPKQTFNIGYGLHSQMQALPVLFLEEVQIDGSLKKTNLDLDFTQSHHFVMGYDLKSSTDWHAKTEIYYQILRGVPVESTPSSFSILNAGADFGFPSKGSLVNEGTGWNTGVEMTLEKFFSQGWYMLLTGSVFDSKYKGSDGIERNTAFNGNYVANFLAGKEFKFGKTKQNAFTIDTKFTNAGGRYETPIDFEASKLKGDEVYINSQAYSQRLSGYFRWDVKLGYTLNSSKRKFTQQFFLDFQNVTNNRNIFQRRYSASKNQIYNVYQIGFFPDVLWRAQF